MLREILRFLINGRFQEDFANFQIGFSPFVSMPSRNVKESLIVRLLRVLNSRQLSGFKAYLECSLFNTNQSLVKVFQILRKKALKAPGTPLFPEDLLKGTDLNPDLFDKYASQLVGHLERFVPFWEQKDDPRHGFADAFRAWEGMGLDEDLLERQYRKMKRKAAKLPPSEWMHFQAFELEHRYLQYKAGLPRKDQTALFAEAERALGQSFQVMQLRYHCGRLSVQRFLSQELDPAPFDLSEVQLDDLPVLGQAYFRAARQLEAENLSLEETEAHYHWLGEQQHLFADGDRQDLYGFLLNSCLQNASRAIGFTELLDRVYMEMIEGKLVYTHQQLPGSHFKNVVSIKIKLGQLVPAGEFIDAYQKDLSVADQAVLLPYTQGLVAYHQAGFRKAVAFFRQVLEAQLTDVYWGLEARLMLWRSYYEILEVMEQEEYEEFLRLYDALRIYVSRRSHLQPERKLGYEHFIRIFNRLARWKEEPATKDELLDLKEEVLGLQEIRQRKWLCEIIDRKLAGL